MNEKEVEDAMQQMLSFIEKEAEDRAMQVTKRTEDECVVGTLIPSAN